MLAFGLALAFALARGLEEFPELGGDTFRMAGDPEPVEGICGGDDGVVWSDEIVWEILFGFRLCVRLGVLLLGGLLLDGLLLAEFDGELGHKCFLVVNVLEMESFHVTEFASGEFELGPLFHISNQLAFSLDVGGHIFFCFFFREKKMERVCVNVYNLARRCAEMGVQGAGEVDPWLVDEVEVVLGRALDGVCVG